jgi:DNA replication protein DnaC
MMNQTLPQISNNLSVRLESLNLLAMLSVYQDLALKIANAKQSPIDYLEELTRIELEQRNQKHIQYLLKSAKLPRDKLLIDFDITRIHTLTTGLIQNLSSGDFIDRQENLLIFGNPGTGKSHLSIALTREWCLQGRKCLYITAASLVQDLLVAKNNMTLSKLIKKLDQFEVLIIDDISYIPYERAESDVLFVLLAQRYEQRSIVITSNLAFSGWNQIFKDEMSTNAAIDRLVHHSTILELNSESYRIKAAKDKGQNLNHKTSATKIANDDQLNVQMEDKNVK